jgi:hypothetical protein
MDRSLDYHKYSGLLCVSSTNKTDILLKVALNTINLNFTSTRGDNG